MAFNAGGDHPYWYFAALKGLVIGSAVLGLAVAWRLAGWMLIFKIVLIGLAGVYAFAHMRRAEWGPINLFTGWVFALTTLPLIITVIASLWFWGSANVEDAEPVYPARPMTQAEAETFYEEALALMDTDRERSAEFRYSELPGGSYPAVVEAFARHFCAKSPGQSADFRADLENHLHLGLEMFANSGPDWAVDAYNRRRSRSDDPFAPDRLAIPAHASEILERLYNAQESWGREQFARRIEELSDQT